MDTVITNWKKNFFTIWTGQAISQFSSSVLQFAIVWYLTDHTGSAMVLTAAMMMGFLPQGVLGPFIGVFIDRYNRKRIMIISDLLISAASFVMVIAGWMGRLSTELILVVLLARSVGSAFHNPCLQAVTPQIVPEGQLTRCAGYSQALESVSQILSPVVAAVLYSSWSLSGIISLDVIGALIAVITLGITQIPELPQEGRDRKVQVLREAKEGFQILQQTILGTMQTRVTCSTCGGEGKIIKNKCKKCGGDGIVYGEEVVSVNIPAGVAEGMQLSMGGKGNAGKHNGVAGDLLILVEEEPHQDLIRDENDLIYNLLLSFPTAALGGAVEIPTIDGKVKVKIDSGTQPGKVLRLRGKGLPNVNGYGTGDLLVNISIYVPEALNKEEKNTLEKMEASDNFKPNTSVKEKIFKKFKSFFD